MIITVEDIRKYREIAKNTQQNRVEVFIRETEELDVSPLFGAEEYEKLAKRVKDDGSIDPDFAPTENETKLLNGGIYTDECGKMKRFVGLIAAESYITFSRFIRNHPLQVTPYGVVVKEGDDSSPASAQSIAGVANDSRKIGEQYLADAVKYWRHVTDSCCGTCQTPVRAARKKFYAIGD